ncbi:MAG: formate dehydrogenase subunit alpha [Methanothrix sp.]|nr:formate dehydrogenase subunit alpha [Methanothrix sp.]OYV13923.1 MAG: formate dehydrogenase, alpha subunit [Methanosaeta sp. ASM2]
MEKVHTTCVYCGCGCGLFLHVEDGRIVGASPSPAHPMSRGSLCIKGWLAGDFVGHPDRLAHPLLRQGDRTVKATWNQALSLAAARLQSIKKEFGPQSLGILTSAKGTNEENYLLMKLGRAALGTNNVDHVARLCHAPTVAGLGFALGSGAMTGSISGLEKSDAILIVGSNTTEQHPLVASYILRARSRGSKLIVADPRKTRLAELADLWLSPRPGTDVVWINALLNTIVEHDLIDRQFIEERTTGFEETAQAARACTPSRAEAISGIAAADLARAADIFGGADRAAIVYAMGVTQHAQGTDIVQALANLSLATGNMGREGTGIYPLRGHQNVQGACDMGALPTVLSGYQSLSSPEVRAKFEEAWKAQLPDEPGLTALEMLWAAEAGSLKGLIIVGENPALSYPDSSRVIKALKGLEFLLVSDIFPTETTALADVVLPAACFAEKDGTFTSTERRVQQVRKAVDPPGDARAEWEWICDLSRRLGQEADYASPASIMAEIASLTPSYGGIDYQRLGPEGLQWPCPCKDHPGTSILHVDCFSQGRAHLRPVFYSQPAEIPDADYPFTLNTGRSLYHFHTGTMTRRTSLLDREIPAPFVEINLEDARLMGIREGMKVRVETRRGSIAAEARLVDSLPRGSLFMPIHFSEAPANALTAQSIDPLSKIAELKVSAASLHKVMP